MIQFYFINISTNKTLKIIKDKFIELIFLMIYKLKLKKLYLFLKYQEINN